MLRIPTRRASLTETPLALGVALTLLVGVLLLPQRAMAAPEDAQAPIVVGTPPAPDPAPAPPAPAPTPAPANSAPAVVVVTAPPAAAPPPPSVVRTTITTRPIDTRAAALAHQRNSGIGMAISGFTIFGTSYLISALIGTISLDLAADVGGSGTYGRRMLIPVAGPFMAIPRADSATGGLFTGLVGAVQIGGLLLGTTGAIKLGRANRQLRMSADAGGLSLHF